MPATTAPNTLAVANAIVAFAQALTYANSSLVYSNVSLGAQKDIIDAIAGGKVCLEIYANEDDSQHQSFGGKIRDEQSWFLLSLVSMDDASLAEALIYQVRDALVRPFQIHATLGDAGSVFHSQIKPNSGRFIRISRNGQEVRGHIIELFTRQEWYVPTPPGVIA